MKLAESLLNLLFPPRCPFCGRVQSAVGICPVCEKGLPWVEEGKVLRQETGNLRCAAPLWYEGLAREGLLGLKFRGTASGTEAMGETLARCAAEQFGGEFDVVTWVPVSRKRLRKRGYDQSRLLAEAVCRCWQTRPVRMLQKIVDNPPQSGLRDAAARRANVLGAYEAVRPERIRGKRILLVDDICTSGATLRECIRVLEVAGAADVVCLAAAQTREHKVDHKR